MKYRVEAFKGPGDRVFKSELISNKTKAFNLADEINHLWRVFVYEYSIIDNIPQTTIIKTIKNKNDA